MDGLIVARLAVQDKPLFCKRCDRDLREQYKGVYDSTAPVNELVAIIKKRTARIIKRKWPDRLDWGCNSCGRWAADREN